jgi:hypothetical protein
MATPKNKRNSIKANSFSNMTPSQQHQTPGTAMVWTNEAVEASDFLVFRDAITDKIQNVIAPNGLQVGLFDQSFIADLNVTGRITGSGEAYFNKSVTAKLGYTGSLQKLFDGSNYLVAGANVTVTNNAAGSITIAANAAATTANALTAGDGLTFNAGSTFDGSAAKTLTVDINARPQVTPATGDFVLVHDITDGALKKVTVNDIQSVNAMDIAGLSSTLTIASDDLIAGADIDDSNNVKKFSISDLSSFQAANSSSGWGINQSGGRLYLRPSDLGTAAAVNPASDTFIIDDADDGSSLAKKTTIASVVDAIRGTSSATGLSSTSGVLSLDINSLSTATPAAADSLVIYDDNASALKKIAFSSIGGAPTDAQYVVLTSNGTLSNESVLAAGDGLDLSAATFSLDLKSSGGLKITSTELEVEPADFAGSGLEDDGSDNLRISSAAAGTGLTGGAGSALSVLYGASATTAVRGDITAQINAGYGLTGGLSQSALGAGFNTTLDVEPADFAGTGVSVSNNNINTYLSASSNITITTGSNSQLTIALNSGLAVSSVISPVLTGSLTKLANGTSYLIAGSNVAISSGSSGAITISATSAGGGAVGTITEIAANVGITGGGSSGNVAIAIDNSIVATLSGSQFSGNIGVSGSLGVTGGLSGSLTQLSDGTSYLIAGTGVTINSGSSGAVTIATSAAAGILGAAEDADYTDGLFTDFTTSTPVGTAVDRFNEVLKGLAPAAAPTLDDIACNDTGVSAKLSFGNSESISGYTNVRPSTLTPANSLSDIDINSAYSSTSSSNNIRIACFGAMTTVDGKLNEDVSVDGVNYAADSFGDGSQGTLKLYVNDNSTAIHTTDLSTFGSGNSFNGNSSGFNLSATTPGHFADSSNFATFQHRQGTYVITPANQRNGWNFARVVHTVGGADRVCNYVEWVNDPTGAGVAMSVSGASLSSLSMTGTKNLSGVKYHTGGTAAYAITIANAYRNVYSTSQITFGGSNVSVSAQNIPSINHGAGEDETKSIVLSGITATINADPILNSSISVTTNVPHPLKSNLSNAGNESISGILLYNLNDTATVLSEPFRGETYRMKNAAYNAQGDVGGSNVWSSTDSLLSVDGMLVYNQTLVAPRQGANSGNFAGISNGPGSNVNYSGISSGTRTYYRKFTNNSGGSKTNFNLTINGSGTIVANGGTLNSSNVKVFCKMPSNGSSSTGWMDIASSFATGQTADNNGCLVGSLDSSLNATNEVTFGTQSVGSNEFIIVKIHADASWTGNISQATISWL